MIKKLKEDKGSMFAYTIAIILSLLLIFTGITEYFRLKTIVKNVEDIFKTAIINASIENFGNVYKSNREGYTSAYEYDTRTITKQKIYAYGRDHESGVEKIEFPNGKSIKGDTGSWTATENGKYFFKIYDKAGNIKEEYIIVDEIDTEFIWLEDINAISIYNEMKKIVDIKPEGGGYKKETENGILEWRVSAMRFNIDNPPLRSSPDKKFSAESKIDLEIPLSFGWEKMPPLKIALKVKSEYMPIF